MPNRRQRMTREQKNVASPRNSGRQVRSVIYKESLHQENETMPYAIKAEFGGISHTGFGYTKNMAKDEAVQGLVKAMADEPTWHKSAKHWQTIAIRVISRTLHNLLNRIEGFEETIGGFDAIEHKTDTKAALAEVGVELESKLYKGSSEFGIAYTLKWPLQENFTVIEFGSDEVVIEMKALAAVLIESQKRLDKKLEEMVLSGSIDGDDL